MRRFFVLLLLVAATVHPFAHLQEDSPACPCVHGARVEVATPVLAGPAATQFAHAPYRSALLVASLAGQVPARAPPVAA